MKNETTIRAGNRIIEISHPDKILFPISGITKYELIEYYALIADYMIPYIKNRPLTLVRCPNGINTECFYQKNMPSFYPPWVKSIPVEKKDESIIHYVNCTTKASLVYIANQGCITPHPWLSKLPELNHPDKIIFDLDPSTNDFTLVRKAALQIKKILDEQQLPSFVMTTGSKGLHVIIPIKATHNFDDIRAFAKQLAQETSQQQPDICTTEVRIDKRAGKVFIDYLRNAWSATSVAPYAVRTKEHAPVATPITWDEVASKTLKPDKYTINNVFKKIEENPWKNFNKARKTIKL